MIIKNNYIILIQIVEKFIPFIFLYIIYIIYCRYGNLQEKIIFSSGLLEQIPFFIKNFKKLVKIRFLLLLVITLISAISGFYTSILQIKLPRTVEITQSIITDINVNTFLYQSIGKVNKDLYNSSEKWSTFYKIFNGLMWSSGYDTKNAVITLGSQLDNPINLIPYGRPTRTENGTSHWWFDGINVSIGEVNYCYINQSVVTSNGIDTVNNVSDYLNTSIRILSLYNTTYYATYPSLKFYESCGVYVEKESRKIGVLTDPSDSYLLDQGIEYGNSTIFKQSMRTIITQSGFHIIVFTKSYDKVISVPISEYYEQDILIDLQNIEIPASSEFTKLKNLLNIYSEYNKYNNTIIFANELRYKSELHRCFLKQIYTEDIPNETYVNTKITCTAQFYYESYIISESTSTIVVPFTWIMGYNRTVEMSNTFSSIGDHKALNQITINITSIQSEIAMFIFKVSPKDTFITVEMSEFIEGFKLIPFIVSLFIPIILLICTFICSKKMVPEVIHNPILNVIKQITEPNSKNYNKSYPLIPNTDDYKNISWNISKILDSQNITIKINGKYLTSIKNIDDNDIIIKDDDFLLNNLNK